MRVGTIKTVQEEMESGIYDFTENGKCSNCGNCCSNHLPLSLKEINRIKKYIVENNICEQKRFTPAVGPTLDMTCPFRSNAQKKCLIYPVRPLICRDWLCSKPQNHIKADKRLYKDKRIIVNVRNVFFPKENP